MANALTLSLAHGAPKRVMRATHPMTARNYGYEFKTNFPPTMPDPARV
jgi:hypothetical protein